MAASVIAAAASRARSSPVAPLQRQRPLPRRGHEARRVERRAGAVLAPQALQPGARQHDRVQPRSVPAAAQAGVHVAVQLGDLEVLAGGPQLGYAADAARAHPCSGRELLDAGGAAQHVLRCSPGGCADQLQALGQLAGQSLAECTARSIPPVQQRPLDLVHPAGLVLGRGSAVAAPV